MGAPLDQAELRRRAIDGVREEVRAFGGGAPDSRLIERDGLLAAVCPATPQRSIFNSVFYTDPAALAAELDSLSGAYDDAGVDAWTVWVPDADRATAELLGERGHVLDSDPRAMAFELAGLAPPRPRPDGIERGPGDGATAARLNDLAYGYGQDGFRGALAGETAIRWHGAFEGGEPVSVVGAIEAGDDCVITGVATPPEHRRRGIAGWLLWSVLEDARSAGRRTASLQASKAGAPTYERLGFIDLGFIEMWELRR
jgi:GNAT superfamily N-acetyltransferase